MRQFLLAGTAAYSAAATADAVVAGAVAFFVQIAGKPTATATGVEILGKADLVLGRSSALGGPVILPIHKNNFTYVKAVYAAGTKFVATVTIPAPATKGSYGISINLNGQGFNLRNLYSVDEYVPTDGGLTAAQLAAKLVAKINANTAAHGIIATLASATITLTADKTGPDYTILPNEKLQGTTVTYTTKGAKAFLDAAYIQDLANKAAADKGFNYTWSEDRDLLYPNYDQNPLAQPNGNDVGYTVFTMRFAEPRDMKTRDEVVHQIVQVGFPTGAAGIATFETVVKSLAGVPVPVV